MSCDSNPAILFAFEEESATLRPLRAAAPLQKERGVRVFRAGKPLSLDQANRIVREAREQRDRRTLGERHR